MSKEKEFLFAKKEFHTHGVLIGNEELFNFHVFLKNIKGPRVPGFCRKGIPYMRGSFNKGFVEKSAPHKLFG